MASSLEASKKLLHSNALAHKLLVESALVDSSLDLYKVITDSCGAPPYYGSKLAPNAPQHCALISDNEEYHYDTAGWRLLAGHVGTELRRLLRKGPHPSPPSPAASAAPATMCPLDPHCVARLGKHMCQTGCASGTTCVADQFSNSGWGCCLEPSATSCASACPVC